MYNFNSKCLEILTLDDRDMVRNRLMDLARNKLVPQTGSGVTRHVTVYIAWNCKRARAAAMKAMLAQNERIAQFLGNSTCEPLYHSTNLVLPRSCEIESEPLEVCYDVETCPHADEHAYYLPQSPVVCTATERAVAVPASSTGFLVYNGVVMGRGAMLADGVMFAPAHVIRDALTSGGQEWFWRGSTRFSFVIDDTNTVLIGDYDIALVKTTYNELAAAKIDDLIDGKALQYGDKISIVELTPELEKKPMVAEVSHLKLAGYPSCYQLVSRHLSPGDSGSLVIRGGRIVGHYYGAAQNHGVIVSWPSYIVKRVKDIARSSFYDSRAVLKVESDTGFSVIDYFDTGVYDSNPPTAERPTEMKEWLAKRNIHSNKAPASLSQEASEKAVYKWQPVEERFDADYKKAAEELAGHISTLIETRQGKCTPFNTWDDAVNGCELGERRHIKKVDMSTSAGAPWCDNGITKSELIDDSRPDRLVCKPDLVELLDKCEKLLLAGDVAGYTATMNMKDELRDHERVALKKTRLFCATPLHHNVMFRKYYGKWISAYKGMNFSESMHAMGTDVYGTDWNDLYAYLMSAPVAPKSKADPVFLAGDFSRFDTSHSGWKMRQAFSVAAEACSDPSMCDALGMSIGRFGLRFQGREFLVPAGLPSGCQMTTPINCILNSLLWITIWRKATGQGLAHFMQNCRLIVYGDDVVLGIDRSNPWFKALDPRTIQVWMKELGYDLESSDDKPLRWVGMEEVTFLKRRFVPDPTAPGVVHAPRPLEDVWTQLMWRRHEPNYEAQKCCFAIFAAEIGQHDLSTQQSVLATLAEIIASEKPPEYLRQAYVDAQVRLTMKKSHNKQLELEDLIKGRLTFVKLW
uniref:Nonstructural protein n=1 Tax=Suncus murinus picorna-like virus 1 TaxID=3139571 RepID=A0AB38ZKD3_9VIRU